MNLNTEPVPTKAAIKLNNSQNDFRVSTFIEPKGKLWSKQKNNENLNNKESSFSTCKDVKEDYYDLKAIRRDVLKFAINNQPTEKKKKKMVVREVERMGLRGPKKTYKNYKVLLAERKRAKQMREARKLLKRPCKVSTRCLPKKVQKERKKRPPVTSIDQHYGTIMS